MGKCDPAVAKLDWTGPDTTSHCFINGQCVTEGTIGRVVTGQGRRGPTYGPDPCSKCIPSVSGTDYSPVTEKGCKLDMATFTAACYDDQGAMTMNDTAKVQLMADKASMTTTVATMTTTVATMTTAAAVKDATISTLQADKTTMTTAAVAKDAMISTLQADKAALQADKATTTTTVAAKDATISTLRTAKEAAEQDGAAKAATIEAKDVLIVDQEA